MIDRRSLNHVTLGAGSPFTLHVIFTRLPSLAGSLAKLWINISMEAFLPAKMKKKEMKLFADVKLQSIKITLGGVEIIQFLRVYALVFTLKKEG